jgi:YD repeat-containing protein
MVQVQGNEYDNGNAGGDGNLTLETLYVDASTTRVTSYGYDFRNRRTSVTGEESSYTAYTYDNLDQLLQVDQRNGSVTGNLIGRKMTKYDDRGRVYQTIKYAVDPSTGTVGNSLTDNVWYDPSGNVVKRLHAGSGLFQKVEHDGINRPIMQYQAYNTSASGYPYPVNVTNDTVMQQTETDFDDASNVIQQTARNRFHNATGTGALTSPGGSQPKARVSYVAMYPDPLGRLINTANYGTNGGSSFSRPNTTPTRSATVLVSTTNYNDRGEAYQKVDPQGKVDQSAFDDAARLTQLLENYVSGGTNPDENRESDYTYNADSKVETMTAKNSVTGDQVTMWTYGVTLSNSDIASKELLRSKEYPDGGSDTVTYQYNRLGQLTGVTDQMGSVRTLEYDGLGRLTQDRVTTLGSGVDGTVRRVSRSYEIRGMLEKLTSYDNATVGSGTVINEVQYAYNSFSQLITEYQSHSGAVNTSTTPKVQYAYDDGSANTIRRTSVTYADGRVVNYDYGSSSGMNDVLSRLASLIDDDATHLADYTYLGLNQIVQVDSPQPN